MLVKASVLEAIARLTARDHLLIVSSRGATMDGSPDKLAALVDVVRALDRLDAQHALVGGVAVGIRSGVPRATLDTDIAVGSTVSPNQSATPSPAPGSHRPDPLRTA